MKVGAIVVISFSLAGGPAGASTPAGGVTENGGSGAARPLWLLELQGKPAVESWVATAEAATAASQSAPTARVRQHLEALQAQHDRLVAALQSFDPQVPVLYHLQRAFNGVAVAAGPEQLESLRQLSEVTAIHPLPPLQLNLVSTAPLIGAPSAWAASLTGRGIKIGIIDTGVDYLHKAFGGPGTYAGHTFDDHTVPWTAKVVGGWDFVGDDYNGSNTARPDGDPMDCNGHGTHVAGIAAGYGVTSAGQTYGGPWGAGTDLQALAIGPGVAPEAQIYALKVFGCSGSTGYAPAALEWALDPNRDGNFSDRLDVVNLSLGSPFGAPGGVYATIADNAARAGMVIVASAGNSGDTHFITGSPATADRAISVANSVDSTSFLSDVEITGPPTIAGRYPAAEAGFGPNLAREGERSGPLAYPTANPKGCASFAAASLNGAVALIDRGDCTFATKVRNAQNAGARGVIVVNNVTGEPIVMGASETDAQGITTPAVMISLADGDRIKAGLGAGGVGAVLSAARRGRVRLSNPAISDTIASSSSRGPRLGDFALKPDITAPGSTIFAAEARSGWGGRSLSGTSMAAPQVAGAVALLRQSRPDWSVEELKARLMNTATPDVWVSLGQTGPRHGAARIGAGRLDVGAAIQGQMLAYEDSSPSAGRVGISFASPEVVVRYRDTRRVRVANKGNTPATLAVSYVPVVDQPGVDISPSTTTVAIPPNSAAALDVVLIASAVAMANQRGDDLSPTLSGAARAWLAEETGHLVFHSATGESIRLPVYAAPRRRATLLARQATLAPPAGSGTLTLDLDGQDLAGGGHPEALLTPLEWQLQAPGGTTPHVGIATDYPDRPTAQALVAFGVVLASPLTTPARAAVSVEIDTNGDSRAEWKLSATDAARAQDANAAPVDVFLARLCSASSSTTCPGSFPLNGAAADQQDTAPFLTDVMVLYARVADLQLSSGGNIQYRVTAEGSSTPWLQYDLSRPGVRPAGGAGAQGFLVPARRGSTVTLAYDTERLAATGSRGVLLLIHHNLSQWRAQTIPLLPGGCALSCGVNIPGLVTAGAQVHVAAQINATGCPATTLQWDPGDSSAAKTGPNITHVFTSPGTYYWRLIVNAGSHACQRTGVISVANDIPRPTRPVLRPLR